ncbi:MAG: hypothetical protein ACM34I_08895 [bacterium]
MEKDILNEVIEVEKEIHKSLELERAKTQEWLEAVKKEAEETFNQEREKLQGAYTEALAQAVHDAEAKASVILREAEEKAGRLGQVPDEILNRIVMKHIRRILPR